MNTSEDTIDNSYQTVKTEFKSEWIKLELEPIITIPQLDTLKEQLDQYKNCRVQVLGEKVERIDTAAFQLLLAFTNSPDVTVAWFEPSEELYNVAKLLGLLTTVGLMTQEDDLHE